MRGRAPRSFCTPSEAGEERGACTAALARLCTRPDSGGPACSWNRSGCHLGRSPAPCALHPAPRGPYRRSAAEDEAATRAGRSFGARSLFTESERSPGDAGPVKARALREPSGAAEPGASRVHSPGTASQPGSSVPGPPYFSPNAAPLPGARFGGGAARRDAIGPLQGDVRRLFALIGPAAVRAASKQTPPPEASRGGPGKGPAWGRGDCGRPCTDHPGA